MSQVINALLDTLFPEKCIHCGGHADEHKTAPLCSQCWMSISPYTGPLCNICGIPLVSQYAITCSECLISPPPFISARYYGIYEESLREAINQLKFKGKRRLAGPLAHFLTSHVPTDCDIIIPVPIHIKRLRLRQFNQSALIAKELAQLSGLEFVWGSLLKIRETLPQVGLHAQQRRDNIKDSFGIQKANMIKHKKVLLVDDVITTGSTIRECSRILKQSGAKEVYALTLARARV